MQMGRADTIKKKLLPQLWSEDGKERVMSIDEVIKEVRNIQRFNYTLAPQEVFDKIIIALERYKNIEERKSNYERSE